MGRPVVGPSLAAEASMRCGSAVGLVVCGMAALDPDGFDWLAGR